MKEKNKIILMVFGVITLVIFVAGFTYSLLKWRSSNNSNFNMVIENTSGLTITFNGGSNVTGQIEPVLTKEEGIIKNFSASTNGLNVPMNIWLEINSLPDALKSSYFKWALYRNSGLLASGDFSTSSIATATSNNATDYLLVSNDVVGSTTVNYTLYLWIDGSVNNDYNMAGKTFDFDLYGTVSVN